MKDKVMLEVLLPATGREYELRVPYDMSVDQACDLMANVLARREPARFKAPEGGSDLMLRGNVQGAGNTLNPNESVRALVEQGVLEDGSPVALV